jgi:hypothetical protein
MLNFVFFFGVLTVSGLMFRTLWRVSITPVNRYFVVHDTPTGVTQVAWLLLQVYVVLGWAALCVGVVRLFVAKPGVVFWWGYYVLALFGCVSPLYDTTPGSTKHHRCVCARLGPRLFLLSEPHRPMALVFAIRLTFRRLVLSLSTPISS